MKYTTIIFFASIICLTSCQTTAKLVFPTDFENNHRSSEIDRRLLKDGHSRVFDFKVYTDTALNYKESDSTMTFGIVFPYSSTRGYFLHKKTVFGNDSAKCTIDVQMYGRELHQEKTSFVSSLITGNNNSQNDPSVNRLYDLSFGVIETSSPGPIVRFRFEKFNSPDQARKTNGYLLIDKDSLVVEPIFEEHNPPISKLLGLRLIRNDTIYAVLQHDPTFILSREVLHLSTRATVQEQLIIAAFFTVVDDTF